MQSEDREKCMRNPFSGRSVAVIVAAFGLAGCVSQEKYDELEKQNTELRAENMKLTEASLFLSGELLEADREVEMLELQQERLADEVARWALEGAVKMELLRSGLQIVLPNEVPAGFRTVPTVESYSNSPSKFAIAPTNIDP